MTSHRVRAVASTVLALLAVAAMVTLGCRPAARPYVGSLFASDAGQSHGGLEYTATWTATLVVTGNSGTLKLTLETGLGDALTKHEYAVTDFSSNSDRLDMKLDGKPLVAPPEDKDTIWDGQFNGYFIASWGGDAPAEEIRGTISATYFPGLGPLYYVELRLLAAPPEVRSTR